MIFENFSKIEDIIFEFLCDSPLLSILEILFILLILLFTFLIGTELGLKVEKKSNEDKSPLEKNFVKYYFEPKEKNNKNLEEKYFFQENSLFSTPSGFSENKSWGDSHSTDICYQVMDEKIKSFMKYSQKEGELEMYFVEGENEIIDKIEKTEVKTKFLDVENNFSDKNELTDQEFIELTKRKYSYNE